MPEKKVVQTGEVVLDFSGVKPFEPLDPNHKYLARVTKLENGEGPKGAKSHLELTIEAPEMALVEEWVPDEEAEGGMSRSGMTERTTKAKGRMLFRELSLTPQSLPFLYEFIGAADPNADLRDNKKFRYNPKNYMGLPVCVSIVNEAFEEQIRARVKHFYPASAYKE